jgi:ubiquinone/menaquinone biosynthesis C-methylase UbiE
MATFDERAREWDTPERVARAEIVAQAIRENTPLDRTLRVIDLGAGTGLLGLALADEVGELILAEPSAGMLEVAMEKLAASPKPNVAPLHFDLLADEPPGEPFDLAISLLVLHHLADTAAALAAVRRLLRPSGRIALVDLDAEDGSFHDADAEGIHHNGFGRGEIAEIARAAGFVDVEVRSASEIERDGRTYPLFLLLGRRT